MTVPDLIPIEHDEYHTSTIGTCDDGEFFGCVVAAFAEGYQHGNDWQQHKRWYAVLHRFDHDGTHLRSDVWFAGTTADGEDEAIAGARSQLAQWLDALPGRCYGDIAIRLFQFEVDGAVFGLVDETDADWGDGSPHVELHPNDLGFDPPWNGEYDT